MRVCVCTCAYACARVCVCGLKTDLGGDTRATNTDVERVEKYKRADERGQREGGRVSGRQARRGRCFREHGFAIILYLRPVPETI